MTQTAWADLPNAKHVDRILADLKKNPEKWAAARDAAWAAARDAAWAAARNTARVAAWDAAYDAARTDARDAVWDAAYDAARTDARDAVWYAAWYAGWGAISALIAYDDCAYLLDEKPEHVKMLGLLGNEKAILLYSACVALHQKEVSA